MPYSALRHHAPQDALTCGETPGVRLLDGLRLPTAGESALRCPRRKENRAQPSDGLARGIQAVEHVEQVR